MCILKHTANIRRAANMFRKVAEHGEGEDLYYLAWKSSWGEQESHQSVCPGHFFLGRDDKFPSHLMTVAHILCDEMLLSNGKLHLWEVSHMCRLSQMLVIVPGTGSSVSELSTFPSMWCKALPALLPQQSQSWEVEGSVAGLKPVASVPREKGAACLVSHSFVQTFSEISGFAHFHEFFTFASGAEDVVWTDPWVPGSKRAKAVRCLSLFPHPPFFFGSHQILHNLFNSSPEVKDRNSCQLCGAQWSAVSMQSLHLPPGSGFLIGMAVSRDNASRADAELQTTEGWKGKRKVCLLQPALKGGKKMTQTPSN